MPQGDKNIRKTLAAIPAIFRTLEVIVILPRPICRCLRQGFDAYQLPETNAMASRGRQTISEVAEELAYALVGGRCFEF
jgi:hypothetical protein